MLELVFFTKCSERGLMVTDLVSVPLSWSDYHLIKCNLSVALPPRREHGPILMDCPRRLLDPLRFQDTMRGIPAVLSGAPVKALVDVWVAAVTRAVDIVASKRPLSRRAWVLVYSGPTRNEAKQELARVHLEKGTNGL